VYTGKSYAEFGAFTAKTPFPRFAVYAAIAGAEAAVSINRKA
jgi:hypothetical protein